jgi:predicted extracellular nuclease
MKRRTLRTASLLALLLALVLPAQTVVDADGPAPVAISEIRIDQPSSDYDEYLELTGQAGTSLDGLTYLVIGDGYPTWSGVVEAVIDLSGQAIPDSGYFVAAEESFALGTADLTTYLNFENSDNVTHLLVNGFTGTNGQDLDTDDDGVLDTTPWSQVVDCVALVETVGSGDRIYCATSVGPDGRYVPGHVFQCSGDWQIGPFDPVGVVDTPGAANSCCGNPAPVTMIHDIQGNGMSSPIEGDTVVVEAVVVGDFQGSDELSGYFLQEENPDTDNDPMTSEGIFVYDPYSAVSSGDVIRLAGEIDEYYGMTEITDVSAVEVCSNGAKAKSATIDLPLDDPFALEPYEGMHVRLPQELTVSENYNLGRYGELVLSNGRLMNPTNVVPPGAPALALQAANDLNRIVLDDGSSVQNPDPIVHPDPGLSAINTLRSGDTVKNLQGVLAYAYSAYRVHAVEVPSFHPDNPRTTEPIPVGGATKIASLNVLNYFTTIDTGTWICGPSGDMECRGADSPEEFARQRAKIISALTAIDADIVGLIEIENNAIAAVQDLVDGLNDAMGPDTYAFVDTGTIGTDAIKVALIYKPATFAPAGDFAILDSTVDSRFVDTKNRPVLAQSFEEQATGEKLTIAVNHLKSKGSPCDDVGDPDVGDGQGNCNGTRTAAAQAMADWLAADPTGSGDPDVLIIGDLNAYAMEDPIAALKTAGYTDLVQKKVGTDAYSYIFYGQAGYLDNALSSASLTKQVAGVTVWHINADEPHVLNYDTEYKSPDQVINLYNNDPYRASDHDPLVIGLKLK